MEEVRWCDGASSGPCGVGGVGSAFSDDDMLFVVCFSKVLSLSLRRVGGL